MLQEIELLLEHNLRMYCTQLLLNYKPSIEKPTECFYINLEKNTLQHRTQLQKHQIEDLIKFLQEYLNKLDIQNKEENA